MLPALGGEVEEREQRVGDLYARLEPPWKLIDDVAELVDPVTLLACLRPHIAHGRPEAEGSIADRDQGSAHAPALQIAQHSLPTLGALAVAGPPTARGPGCAVVSARTGETQAAPARACSARWFTASQLRFSKKTAMYDFALAP